MSPRPRVGHGSAVDSSPGIGRVSRSTVRWRSSTLNQMIAEESLNRAAAYVFVDMALLGRSRLTRSGIYEYNRGIDD